MTEQTVHHERALIGLILLDPSVLDRCELELAGYPWIDQPCRQLFPVLIEMRRNGDPIADVRNVVATANRSGTFAIGEVARLAHDAGMAGQDAYHLSFLTEAMDRSRLRRIAAEIQRLADDPMERPEETHEWISKQIYATPSKSIRSRNVGQVMTELVEQSRSKKPTIVVKTGLRDLDPVIGGFRPGQLIILAARPSVGKSALASQIAIDAAKENHGVLFVSLEMTAAETVARALAAETGLDSRKILNGELASHEVQQASQIAQSYNSVPLEIEDRRGMNIDRLSLLIKARTARKRLSLVVVDYIGLIAGDRRKPRWESITEISNQLKTIAQTEQVPILALCQLNRDSEGEVPKLSHLRDSGSIEQDADIVLLLHRETRNATETQLFIAKNRNGPTGKIQLEYEPARFQFKSTYNDFTHHR